MDLFTPYSEVLKYNPNHDERGRFTSGPASGLSSQFAQWMKFTTGTASYDQKIASGERLLDAINHTKPSRSEWHKFAKAIGMRLAASTSGVKVKGRIVNRISQMQAFLWGVRAMAGRSAA